MSAGLLDQDSAAGAPRRYGFTDALHWRSCAAQTHYEIKALRNELNIHASFKMVDTCAAEFDAATPYYYSTYDEENEAAAAPSRKKVLVLGSGPIRIGQGIEFDYCSVHSVWSLKELGCDTIIVNNNPETVSTDFDVADKLYFEPLTPEDVQNIVELEKPVGRRGAVRRTDRHQADPGADRHGRAAFWAQMPRASTQQRTGRSSTKF